MEILREGLSNISHDIWNHWMKYMFSIGTFNDDGTWTMPADKVTRWQRQMNTPYEKLTEQEKESDREQADKILTILNKYGPVEVKHETLNMLDFRS